MLHLLHMLHLSHLLHLLSVLHLLHLLHRLLCDQAAELGELRLEVLQCDGLEKTDMITGTDAYVVLLCEGVIARTCTIWDTEAPSWPPYAPRAFTMPISHPCADIRIGVFDDDGSTALDEDDHLGWVPPILVRPLALVTILGQCCVTACHCLLRQSWLATAQ